MRRGVLAVVLLGCVLAANVASAQTLHAKFDEWGNGQWNAIDDSGTWQTLYSHIDVDPTGGIDGKVLIYDLPYNVGEGDVAFYEPNTKAFSDAFRFYDDALGNGHLIFYSDIDDKNSAPADSGIPVNLNPQSTLMETGSEGGIQWCRYTNQTTFNYEGLSDTPEPFTMLPIVGALALAWRRGQRK